MIFSALDGKPAMNETVRTPKSPSSGGSFLIHYIECGRGPSPEGPGVELPSCLRGSISPRSTRNIMKIIFNVILFTLLFSQSAYAYQSPGAPQGFVNDFAGVLSQASRQELEQSLDTFAKEKNHEIAIVTIKTLDGDAIEEYANRLFREWGIGTKKNNNGVLFLAAIDDRKMRIEVGYGLEGALTDLESKHIQDDVVRPLFRNNDYSAGIAEGAKAIMQAIEGEIVALPRANGQWANGIMRYGGEIFFLLFLFGSWIVSILGRTKSWWLGGVLGGLGGALAWFFSGGWYWVAILGFGGLFFDYFVSKNYKSHLADHHPAWWAGGAWGGWDRWGGGGGGFGGFGGGSSGGGGSSSSW